MHNSKSGFVPLASHFKLFHIECLITTGDKDHMKSVPYSNVIGSLMFLMVCTRLDLTFFVSVVSRYMPNLDKLQWQDLNEYLGI